MTTEPFLRTFSLNVHLGNSRHEICLSFKNQTVYGVIEKESMQISERNSDWSQAFSSRANLFVGKVEVKIVEIQMGRF
jgi:hypothetical protein